MAITGYPSAAYFLSKAGCGLRTRRRRDNGCGENDDGAFGFTGEFGERDGCAVNIFQREVTRFVTDFIPGLRGKYDEYQHEGSEELFFMVVMV